MGRQQVAARRPPRRFPHDAHQEDPRVRHRRGSRGGRAGGSGVSTAAIVVIGNEILSAKIADENGPWLTRELRNLGVEVRRIETVPDEIPLIVDARWFPIRASWACCRRTMETVSTPPAAGSPMSRKAPISIGTRAPIFPSSRWKASRCFPGRRCSSRRDSGASARGSVRRRYSGAPSTWRSAKVSLPSISTRPWRAFRKCRSAATRVSISAPITG
ncbi:MAG: hypothetical protein E6J62_14360 [Deltaproteobacteria bacterium]|nr:MAG: hypothetical protein E6J62_14360 [Deltaproteobacteria bacterium]